MSAAIMMLLLLPKSGFEWTTEVNNEYGIVWWDQDLVKWIIKEHPETAIGFKSQKSETRAYDLMSDISYIIRKLRHQRTLSDAELRRTSDKLAYLTEAGLNVEWLRPNLEVKKREAYVERKKRDACEARIVELKQEVKKLKLAKSGLKAELKNEEAKLNPRSFWNLLGNCFCL
ncbi:unnamed protein product [Brassica rapa subsp. trilocularis]